MENKKTFKYETGFVLSGGFIKGFAHLGAIQYLLERDIRPDVISGVSAGSLVGALFADGNEPYEVLEFFKGLKFQSFTSISFLGKGGFLELDDLIDFLKQHLKSKNIEDLPIPTIITATDLDHGRSVHFTRGSLPERIAASCCMPVLFTPININGTHYVDGGVLMNLPVSTLRGKCRHVVAINVSPLIAPKYKMNVFNVAMRSYDFIFRSNTIPEREDADLLIEPENLFSYSNMDLDKAQEIFERGYQTAKETVEQMKETESCFWK